MLLLVQSRLRLLCNSIGYSAGTRVGIRGQGGVQEIICMWL